MEKRGQTEIAFIMLAVIGSLVFFGAMTAQPKAVQLSPGGEAIGDNFVVIVLIIALLIISVALAVFLIYNYVNSRRKEEIVSVDIIDKFYLAVANAEKALNAGRIGDAKKFYAVMQEIYLSLDKRQRKRVLGKAKQLYSEIKQADKFR